MKRLLLVTIVLAACKPDPDSKPAAGSASATAVARPGRPKGPAPSLPGDNSGTETSAAPDSTGTERPSLDQISADRDMRREAWRKQREAELDTNKDGQVTDDERTAFRHKRLADMHTRLDVDGDGKLSPSELKGMRRGMRFDDPAAVDKDGNGDISVEELDQAMQQQRRMIRNPRWAPDDPSQP